MKGLRLAALAAALILAAGALPWTGAHGQTRSSVLRAFDLGRGSRIGVSVQDIEEADAKDVKQQLKAGVLVETVEPDGPADKAGVKAGDAITEFDGERVRSVRQFSRLVQETPSGRSVAVALSRGGQRVTVNVTPDRSGFDSDTLRVFDRLVAPTPPVPPAAPTPRAVMPALPFEGFRYVTRGRLGVTLETLDDQLAAYFGVKEGVLVKSVASDSAAAKAGLKAGDVITSVNGRHVYEVSDVNRALERMEDADEFTLEVVRDRKPQTIKGKLDTRPRGRGSMAF